MKITKLFAFTALPALVAAGLAVPGTAEAAGIGCDFQEPTISRSLTVVGITYSQTTTMSVEATNCSPSEQQGLDVTWETSADWDPPELANMTPTYLGNNVYRFDGDYTVDPEWLGPQHATDFASYVVVRERDTFNDILWLDAPTLRVRRATRWGYFNASPEPVKKGKSITIWGWLERANWEKHAYLDYRDQKVELQFRTPTGNYTKVKSLIGNSGEGGAGTYTKVTAVKDGCFRLVYRGNSTTGPSTSKGDCVDVK